MKIIFDRKNPDTEREWLETNGTGGYASSSVSLLNTRKYHGLLVHPVESLEGRYVFLSGIEIIINDGKNIYELGNSRYPGTIHPSGCKYLEKYEKKLFPEWTYRAGKASVILSIFMTDDDGVYLAVENKSSSKCPVIEARVRLIFACRNSHTLTRKNRDIDQSVYRDNKSFRFEPYNRLGSVHINFSKDIIYSEKKYWLENREYEIEQERGFDFREDCFVPGEFSFPLEKDEKVFSRIALSRPEFHESGEGTSEFFEAVYNREKIKREKALKPFKKDLENVMLLKREAAHFFIRNRDNRLSITAGYPWFGEWGRDVMISLPGLTLCRGAADAGLEILLAYAGYVKNGLLPNTLSGTQGFESYNSIDAAMLYFWAAQQLWIYGNVKKRIKEEVFPVIKKMVSAYLDNSVPGFSINLKGFPEAGDKDTQLTWMDAKSRGVPVTPRHGSPVEITALFYNGLKFYAELCRACREKPDPRAVSASKTIEANFIQSYWIEEGGYLADVVRGDYRDESVRPNMLWAAAVPYPLVDREKAEKLVEKTEKELLTFYGLRTLSPESPEYKGAYQGNGDERDSIYHQGTVWPWLLGIYTDAALYSTGSSRKKAEEIKIKLLTMLEKHIYNEGTGFVSEVFDGTDPSRGKGSFAQAWSSAEIIRALYKTGKISEEKNE